MHNDLVHSGTFFTSTAATIRASSAMEAAVQALLREVVLACPNVGIINDKATISVSTESDPASEISRR